MLAALLATGALLAQPFPQTIPVPPGSQPEGVASGRAGSAMSARAPTAPCTGSTCAAAWAACW